MIVKVIKVTYKGSLNTDFDKILENDFLNMGYELVASGYHFTSKTRELEFNKILK